jgi:hypothetical protein
VAQVRHRRAQQGDAPLTVDRRGQLGSAGEEQLVAEPEAEGEVTAPLDGLLLQRRVDPARVRDQDAGIGCHQLLRRRDPVARLGQSYVGVPVEKPRRAVHRHRRQRRVDVMHDPAQVLATELNHVERVLEEILHERVAIDLPRLYQRFCSSRRVLPVGDVVDQRRSSCERHAILSFDLGEEARPEHVPVRALERVDDEVDLRRHAKHSLRRAHGQARTPSGSAPCSLSCRRGGARADRSQRAAFSRIR